MRPENKRNLRTAIFLGTVPFKINADGELQFKWCSLTTVYFAIIFFAVAAYQAFTTYAMVSTALAADFKESLILFPWTSATFCLLLAQIICLIKRKDIAAFFVTLTDLWAEKIDVDMGNFVYKRVRIGEAFLFLYWLSVSCLMGWYQWLFPYRATLLSSVFCKSSTGCPDWVLVTSIVTQIIWIAEVCSMAIFTDVMPAGIVIALEQASKIIQNRLEDNLEKVKARFGEVEYPTTTTLTSVPVIETENNDEHTAGDVAVTNTSSDDALDCIPGIRRCIHDHLELQKCLSELNSVFGLFILVSVSAVFLIPLGTFSSIFKVKPTILNFAIKLGAGAGFLVRGSVVCTLYGNLHATGQALRRRLDLDTDLWIAVVRLDEQLEAELRFWSDSLRDNFCVSAGPYFTCTHSLVLTLYALLTTYMAVLVQSI